MKKMITMIIACVLAIAMVTGLTGCTSSNDATEAEKAAVCYVLANTANSQGLNFNSPMVQDTVYETIRNYGYISVVNADGIPDVVFASSFDIDDRYKSASPERLDMDARSKTTNLIAGMQGVIATDPEVDYLAALNLAVRSLSSLEGYDSKTVVVIGTGLSTTGVLDFQNNLISAEPSTVVELLQEKEEIPAFNGITVYWQQMGDVALPQQALSSAQRIKLQEIYGGIVEAGGGTFVYNETIANPVNDATQYPTVTPVELPADTPLYFEPEVFEVEEDENVFEEPVILTESQVMFIGDKATYRQPEEVMKILQPIAECLIDHPTITILLAGTTAGDTNSAYTMELSQARADVVKQTLVDFGVDPSRIIAVGLGSTDAWHVYGIPTSDKAASCNRKVVLLDASSQTAQEILTEIDE